MQLLQFTLVLLVSVLCVVKGQNYCDNSLCGGRSHIACRHSGVSLKFSPKDYFIHKYLNFWTAFRKYMSRGSAPSSPVQRSEANNSQHTQFPQVNIEWVKRIRLKLISKTLRRLEIKSQVEEFEATAAQVEWQQWWVSFFSLFRKQSRCLTRIAGIETLCSEF